MPEMNSMTLNGQKYDCFVDGVARSMASWSAVIGSASGENINVSDASNYNLQGLRIFGKTTQDGTPTPDAPVDFVSVGDGSIAVNVAGENESQNMTIATPNGLPGIPVASGGNYTDANGQQWICDEIDLARGVYIKRVDVLALDAGSARWKDGIFTAGDSHYIYLDDPSVVIDKGSLFTHGTYELNGILADGKYCSSGAGYFQVVTDLTLDEWRAYLVEQIEGGTPVLLLYALPNFEETALTEEELAAYAALHTYKDNTTVSNDAGAYMELEYVMDAKKYIDSQISTGIIEARVG